MTAGSVGAYVAQVDRLLRAGQELYAATAGPLAVASAEPTVPAAPTGSGLTLGTTDAAARYGQQWRGITACLRVPGISQRPERTSQTLGAQIPTRVRSRKVAPGRGRARRA